MSKSTNLVVCLDFACVTWKMKFYAKILKVFDRSESAIIAFLYSKMTYLCVFEKLIFRSFRTDALTALSTFFSSVG